MARVTRFVRMDVHAETIAVAVAEGSRKPSFSRHHPQLYWLTRLGVHCDVIAPSLVPKMAGDRIKTDRRDAEKLARSYRAGDLSPVWVPGAAHESLRDLVRAREAAKEDELRARHRLSKYLLKMPHPTPLDRRAQLVCSPIGC